MIADRVDPIYFIYGVYDHTYNIKIETSVNFMCTWFHKTMDPRLFEAACKGDTDELKKLLEEDRFLLERCLLAPSAETVLHVASIAGQVDFAREVLRLKPEASSSLNKDGLAAIHIASAHGFVDIVRELLRVNHELGHLRSSDSRTSLHFAAVTGSTEVIRELLSICPASIQDVTVRGETALHLAIKNNQLGAFKAMAESFKHSNVKDLLNAKDEDGNTVLHLATARKQGLTMKLLLGDGDIGGSAVDVNLTTKSGFTALDILDVVQQIVSEPGDYTLRDLLLRAGALRASELKASSQVYQNSSITELPQNQQNVFAVEASFLNPSKLWKMSVKELEESSEGTKNALMVVVVLIANVTYQAILQPPGGFLTEEWNIKPFHGTAVLSGSMPIFIPFTVLNSIGFCTSVAVIILLIDRFPLKNLLRLAVYSLAANYACGFLYIATFGLIVTLMVPMTMAVVLSADPVGFRIWLSKMTVRFGAGSRGISRNETYGGA